MDNSGHLVADKHCERGGQFRDFCDVAADRPTFSLRQFEMVAHGFGLTRHHVANRPDSDENFNAVLHVNEAYGVADGGGRVCRFADAFVGALALD